VLWLDILNNRMFEKSFNTGALCCWELPETVSSIACDASSADHVWLVSERSLVRFQLVNSTYEKLIALPLQGNYRTNDGCVGPDGRYWFGTMLRRPQTAQGAIYSVGNKLDLRVELEGIAIPNTFCWLEDCLLISDSLQQICRRYTTCQSGPIQDKGVFTSLSNSAGTPDGGAVDQNGNVWIALWGGGKVVCYTPEGEPLNEISLPVPQPSSCCFGGPDNNILFITTAREGLTETELTQYPQSGAVFFIQLPVQGAVVHKFSVV
jgi:sugar lactone lactonase YvrE